MPSTASIQKHSVVDALIAFVDLTLYTKTSLRQDDLQTATWMDGFFEQLTQIIESNSGLIVKFIGDAALIFFDGPSAEKGILTLLQAKEEIDRWMQSQGYPSRLEVKIHYGPVVAGAFGGKNRKVFDVIGKTVNAAATLEGKPFVISTEAFRQLSPEGRKYFKKHTPPITYIRVEDRHK